MRKRPCCTRSSRIVYHLLTVIPTFALGALRPADAGAQVNVLTYHGDNARTGLNAHESILTPSSVNTLKFGRLFSYQVDGYTYAQPLYLSNVVIAGKGSHNVVIAATQNDSVYAFDADDNTGANAPYLWYSSLIPNGESVVTSGDVGTGDIVPIIGITGTPVIDSANGTLYVVAKTKDGLGNFFQRLHALDIHTGLDKPGSPVLIQATANGIGDANVNGVITFDPLIQNQRPALLFNNGVVTIGWASHGDNGRYHGWVIGYRYDEVKHTFTRTGVFNTTPNGVTDMNGYPIAAGGVWMSGNGPAADSAGNIYFETGNGSFDASQSNYGDSFVKLSGGLAIEDYFTPANQYNLDSSDEDLGSGGVLLLPDAISLNGHSPLLVGAGKEGKIYLLDRNNLGEYDPAFDNVVQELPGAIGGAWSSPAYFNNTLYYLGAGDVLKAFGFVTLNTVSPNYAGGFSNPAGLTANQSYNYGPIFNGSRLTLTNDNYNEAGSVFTSNPVNTAKFNTRFQFQIQPGYAGGADGMTFTLQNAAAGPNALGYTGGALGYQGISNSVAIKFDLYNNAGEGINSTGLYTNGAGPYVPAIDLTGTGIDLHSGDIMQVDMAYDGTTLNVKITDTVTSASASQSYVIDIPGTIGGPLAYAGFTGGTGGLYALQEVLNWTYTAPNAASNVFKPVAQSSTPFGFPGATPAVSANGNIGGIVWAIQTDAYGNSGPAVLHAYDAANVATELYNSSLNGARDNPGAAVKFAVPTIANGKVYVGAQYQLSVFGLLNRARAVLSTKYGNVRKVNGCYAVDVTVTNIGNLSAANLKLTSAKLGSAAPKSPVLPLNCGTLLVGQSKTTTLTFPVTAGGSGTRAYLSVGGNWNTGGSNSGNFSGTFRITLP